MAILIAALLTFSMTASMMLIPNANAHSPPWNIPVAVYLSVAPNPVGLGQRVEADFWYTPPPTAQGPNGDRWTFYLDVTTPAGVTTQLGPFTSDDTGGTYADYTPTTLGNYTFQAIFPGQTLKGINPPLWSNGVPYVGDYFEPANSSKVIVVVQTTAIGYYPYTTLPLPNAYWQSPVFANNKAWSVIYGNWVMANYDPEGLNYNPYTTAPSSAHILWTKQIQMGGQIGSLPASNIGESTAAGNEETIYQQDQYSTSFTPPLIINGVLYYNDYSSGQGLYGFSAVNLKTGATEWVQNGTGMPVTTSLGTDQPGAVYDTQEFNRLSYGEVFNYDSPNMYGGNAYLWCCNGVAGTGNPNTNPAALNTLRFDMYDAFSGAYICSIVNCTAGTYCYDASGALCEYVLNAAHGWLAFWNSSLVSGMLSGTYGSPSWQWRPHPGFYSWKTGVQWNVSISSLYTNAPFPETIQKVADGVVLADTMSTYGTSPQNYVMNIGYNATTGAQMWVVNETLPLGYAPYSSIFASPLQRTESSCK